MYSTTVKIVVCVVLVSVATTQHSCLSPTDCQNSAPGSNNFCDRDFHCVDGTCRCGHGFGPAPGGGDHHPGGGPGPVGK
ncbi:uncharacterized protein LOC132751209 isoform X3 [Ruditapes philippinarum]|uniref:uncharacterized protein LOC132751209 isoform X3 n=1 Tax=Ruditapes philippinarum TaxID=129788 RepID=UPI00295AFC16|nr:uncharacterized protein LOC132751209 isoform X3 [Ruditapes philippinarum]